MYNFVYRTLNILTGKAYIGMHSSETSEDSYLGSSRDLKKDIKKYGRKNFKVVSRTYFEDRDLAHEFEALFIKESMLLGLDLYNKAPNGTGSCLGEDNHFYGKTHTLEAREKISQSNSGRFGELNSFYGKKHTEEYKRKSSEQKKGYNASNCEREVKRSIQKSTGWWCTPKGCFVSDRFASEITGIGRNAIRNWCKKSDTFVKANYQIPNEYYGRTWKENGFYFISKEDIVSE